MQCGNNNKISPSKEIAYIAVMCALLIGGQYIFSFVVGVEIVTLLLICFSYVFGVRCGVICAAAFSLLRCLIYGFYPAVLILYLIYYPLLCAIFGGLGKVKNFKSVYAVVAINALLICICAGCAACYFSDLIKVSRVYKITVHVLLWVIFALCAALLIVYNYFFITRKNCTDALKLITVASAAAVCTVLFTLLDDIITPLFFGYSRLTALAYFYASFTAMLPQVVCTIVTVSALFLPLTATLRRVVLY